MNTQSSKTSSAEAHDPIRVVLDARVTQRDVGPAAVPDRVLVVPWGEVDSEAGAFLLDEDAANATLAAFAAHGADLPIDYEHQTLGGAFSSPTGQAPAAGWITDLIKVSPDDVGQPGLPATPGLWADVSWTGDGAVRLANREYRYLSPVALVRREDRRLVGLHSVALTNKPAMVGATAVVNRAGGDATRGADGDPAQTHLKALRIVLGLKEDADPGLVLRSAVGRLRELQTSEAHRRATETVEAALSAGQLTPAQREWALALALRDPAEFDRWRASAPVVIPHGRTAPPPRAVGGERRAEEAAARSEWRANRTILEKLCTEDAFVAAALRGSR